MSMTMRTRLRAAGWGAVLALALVAGGAWGQQDATDHIKRAERIESHLLPPVLIKGQPAPERRLADRMAALKVPGVSIAVFDNYRIVFSRSHGVADVESKAPVSVQTIFQAASISKPVTAAAALRLVERGRLKLDEPVNARLTTWKIPENEFTKAQPITLRHLLTHSAGLTVHGFLGYAGDETVPTLTQVLDGEKPANSAAIRADVAVGSRWRYSGGGYTVLQQLLVDVVRTPFPEIMRELVLGPAEMRASSYDQPLPASRRDRAATGYRANGDAVKGKWHTYPEMAAAGLWTTPSDLARFAIQVQLAANGRKNRLFDSPIARDMVSRQFEAWGLGFGIDDQGDALRFTHGGANEGFRCQLVAYVTGGRGVAVMTNSDAGSDLAAEILRAVAREYQWPGLAPEERVMTTLNPAVLPRLAGVYTSPQLRLTVVVEGQRLFVQVFGQPRLELFPESELGFFATERNVRVEFKQDAEGRVNEVIARRPGSEVRAARVTS
jgi:CubicO group peptidase (beta-lactamase class C family)